MLFTHLHLSSGFLMLFGQACRGVVGNTNSSNQDRLMMSQLAQAQLWQQLRLGPWLCEGHLDCLVACLVCQAPVSWDKGLCSSTGRGSKECGLCSSFEPVKALIRQPFQAMNLICTLVQHAMANPFGHQCLIMAVPCGPCRLLPSDDPTCDAGQ